MKYLGELLSDVWAFIRYYPVAVAMILAERDAEAENKRLAAKSMREMEAARAGRKS